MTLIEIGGGFMRNGKSQNMETTTKIRESLKEMFRHNTLSARQAALKDVMNSNIEKKC